MSANDEVLGLDHVVVAVHDLDAAIASYRATGFTVQVGGTHPGRTSHNALIVFQDGAYIELIAWAAPAPTERWWRVVQEHGEGIVDFALLPRDAAAALAAAQARGLQTMTGPLEGGRVRPDGVQLRWQTVRHATPELPFLCGDITPRSLRVPEGDVRQHANGALGIAGLEIAVNDLDAAELRYRALLGPGCLFSAEQAIDGGSLRQLRFTLGACAFTLLSPGPSATPAHSLRHRLGGRGQGVLRIRLATDGASLHGAAIVFDEPGRSANAKTLLNPPALRDSTRP